MRFRKLRIAWSVVWGIACVLLIVLWVRSYWQVDILWHNLYGYMNRRQHAAMLITRSESDDPTPTVEC